jgi:hypothetical protein
MVVEVGSEIEQFVFKICTRPEQQVIQILASKGADQPFRERVEQGNVGLPRGTAERCIKSKSPS